MLFRSIANDSLAAIQAIYRNQGADFLELPNHSLYPRADFFDTQDHLNEETQIAHSAAIGEALRRLLSTPDPPGAFRTSSSPLVARQATDQ